jgi:hypothetical protein
VQLYAIAQHYTIARLSTSVRLWKGWSAGKQLVDRRLDGVFASQRFAQFVEHVRHD